MSDIETDNIPKSTHLTTEYIKETNKNFYSFLKKHKVKGEDVEYTHTCFGPPFGKYFIGDIMDYEKFLILYKRILETGVLQQYDYGGLYVTEKQKKVGPIYIDYDFRFEEKTRQYSTKNIHTITNIYMNIIKKYLDISNYDDLKAYVTEKSKPSFDEKQNNYKDGFHIVFPIPVDVSIRFLIHEEAKEQIKNSNILDDIPFINELDDVIDESVVIRNGWLMYGSKKWNKSYYVLTHIYNYEMEDLDKSKYSKDELAVLFSARRHDEDDMIDLKEEFQTSEMKQHIKTIYDKYNGSKKKKKIIIQQEKINRYLQPVITNANNPNITIAKKLVKILSEKRANKYMDWAPVGWTLHNIDPCLLDDFIEFSKKCPSKFSEYGCRKFWESSKQGGYTIASLYFWAKQDNREEFNNILLESINKAVENASTGSHDDLAKVLFEMYKFEFKCVSKTKNKWYSFYNNRWHYIDQAYTLSNIISDELAVLFGKKAVNYMSSSSFNLGGDRDNNAKKGIEMLRIVDKLKTESFKNSVIASAASRFIDEKFEEKLDSNPNLLGFDNGVYDLQAGIFRKGIPEDYITLSTGYDYNPDFTENHKDVVDVKKYFKQVMTEEDMRDYTLESLASFQDGHIKHQIFRVFTGSGGNAKSQTIDLVKTAMGQYFGVLPTGVLTRKRGGASNATPELADKRGKRFLIIQEPEHDDVVYVGQMKNYTGGDTIMARALYGDPFEYKPQFKIGLVCNKLPNIPANDGGTWRRLRVVPFESEFVDPEDFNPNKPRQFLKDPNLADKMKNWAAPFMWLLLNVYYKKYKDNNYNIKEPAKVKSSTDKYKKDSDKYHEFLSEHIVETKNHNDSISVVELYNTFKHWHVDAGYGRNIPNRNEFVNYIVGNRNLEIEIGQFMGICYKDDWELKQKDKNKKNNDSKYNNDNNKKSKNNKSNDKNNNDDSEDNESNENDDNLSDSDINKFNLDD